MPYSKPRQPNYSLGCAPTKHVITLFSPESEHHDPGEVGSDIGEEIEKPVSVSDAIRALELLHSFDKRYLH